MKDRIDVRHSSTVPVSGRPARPDAKTTAERSKAYRAGLKADGYKAVKCHLKPDAMAYLEALRKIHGVTLSDAISMALAAAIRGDALPLR